MSRKVEVDGGNRDRRVAGEDLAEADLPAGFQSIVTLLKEACLGLGDEPFDVRAGDSEVGEERPDRGGLEVGANRFLDAGMPDFDGDARAVLANRAVDLANRGAGHGLSR